MTIPVGTILKVVAVMSWLDGDIMQNVFNATIGGSSGPYDEADIVADALAWLDVMYGNLTTTVSDECDGAEVRVYEYDPPEDDWDEIGSDAWTWNPTGTGEQLPRGVALLINARTLDADVSGKKYIGGLTEPSALDGIWWSTMLASAADYADDWIAPFTGATSTAPWVPVVWSPTKTQPWVFNGAVIIPTIPAYQRRRKQGVGI